MAKFKEFTISATYLNGYNRCAECLRLMEISKTVFKIFSSSNITVLAPLTLGAAENGKNR